MNEATLSSVNGGLIIPPFAKSNGKILCVKVITPVTNRVIDNNGNKSRIQFSFDTLIGIVYTYSSSI